MKLYHICVSFQTDLGHTLGESAALGAAGVVLWGELSFAKSKVSRPNCMCEDLYSLDLPLCDNLMLSISLNAVSTQTENA